jgi:hypothetical protein
MQQRVKAVATPVLAARELAEAKAASYKTLGAGSLLLPRGFYFIFRQGLTPYNSTP